MKQNYLFLVVESTDHGANSPAALTIGVSNFFEGFDCSKIKLIGMWCPCHNYDEV